MEILMWIMAMVPVVCLMSLQGIGWLTGGMSLIVALACPPAMATIGVMIVASFWAATISILVGQLCK